MRDLLVEHDCTSAQRRGWKGITNGELLRLAAGEFDLFITSDQGIRYQQNLLNVAIAVLQLSTNDIRRLRAAANAIRSAIGAVREHKFQELTIP